MSTQTNLWPCPFCGTQPTEHDQIGYSSVKCSSCKFSIKVKSLDGPPYAPELWNRRAHTSVGDVMIDKAMNARMPGGSPAWVWLFNCEGGHQPEEKHRDWFRNVLTAAIGGGSSHE